MRTYYKELPAQKEYNKYLEAEGKVREVLVKLRGGDAEAICNCAQIRHRNRCIYAVLLNRGSYGEEFETRCMKCGGLIE